MERRGDPESTGLRRDDVGAEVPEDQRLEFNPRPDAHLNHLSSRTLAALVVLAVCCELLWKVPAAAMGFCGWRRAGEKWWELCGVVGGGESKRPFR